MKIDTPCGGAEFYGDAELLIIEISNGLLCDGKVGGNGELAKLHFELEKLTSKL